MPGADGDAVVSPFADTAQIYRLRDLACVPHATAYKVADVGIAAEAEVLGVAGILVDADWGEEGEDEYSAALLEEAVHHILDHKGPAVVDRQQK